MTAAGMLLSAAWRAWLWRATGSVDRVYFGLDTRLDGLLGGALAALLVSSGALRATPAVSRVLNWGAHLTFFALIVYLRWGWVADPLILDFGLFALNLGMVLMVLSLLFSPGPLLRLVFECPPLVWLGKISYGLYLWHMVTFWMGGLLPQSSSVEWAPPWLTLLASTVAVAAVSFYALERPLLKLKRRFERVPAPTLAGR
jgi:peptidoglycan/LPS O-acetylase OafA/YrhL